MGIFWQTLREQKCRQLRKRNLLVCSDHFIGSKITFSVMGVVSYYYYYYYFHFQIYSTQPIVSNYFSVNRRSCVVFLSVYNDRNTNKL